MVDQELVSSLHLQMRRALATQSTGSLRVGPYYVQWAGYPGGGLQIECVSNTFLKPELHLTPVQHRALADLRLREPLGDWPNHYRRFYRRRDLFDAAIVVARIVDEVLGPLPSPKGHVCVVAHLDGCSAEVLQEQVDGLRSLREDTSLVLVGPVAYDAHALGVEPVRVGRWVKSGSVEAPVLLTARDVDADGWDPRLLRAVRRLRELGQHVLVVVAFPQPGSPELLDLVSQVANRVVEVGDELDGSRVRSDQEGVCTRPLFE